MLKWCAYCQKFLGEIRPFDDFGHSHGICTPCSLRGLELSDSEFAHSLKLKRLQANLLSAGRQERLDSADQLVTEAIAASVRPVDILMGLITPLLYHVGEQWKKGILSVADEHRFTAFSERVYEIIRARTAAEFSGNTLSQGTRVLLLNAPGNQHTLAIRILALWLQSRGMQAQALYPLPSFEALRTEMSRAQPEMLLVSVALAEQREGVLRLADLLDGTPGASRPRVIIGGYAVKAGMVEQVPGTEQLADISQL